jgi:hypothetical protein
MQPLLGGQVAMQAAREGFETERVSSGSTAVLK